MRACVVVVAALAALLVAVEVGAARSSHLKKQHHKHKKHRRGKWLWDIPKRSTDNTALQDRIAEIQRPVCESNETAATWTQTRPELGHCDQVDEDTEGVLTVYNMRTKCKHQGWIEMEEDPYLLVQLKRKDGDDFSSNTDDLRFAPSIVLEEDTGGMEPGFDRGMWVSEQGGPLHFKWTGVKQADLVNIEMWDCDRDDCPDSTKHVRGNDCLTPKGGIDVQVGADMVCPIQNMNDETGGLEVDHPDGVSFEKGSFFFLRGDKCKIFFYAHWEPDGGCKLLKARPAEEEENSEVEVTGE